MCNYYLPFCKFRKTTKTGIPQMKKVWFGKNSPVNNVKISLNLPIGKINHTIRRPSVWQSPSLIPSQSVNTSSPLSVTYKPQTLVLHANKSISIYIAIPWLTPGFAQSNLYITAWRKKVFKFHQNSNTKLWQSFSKTKNAAFQDNIRLNILNSRYKVLILVWNLSLLFIS